MCSGVMVLIKRNSEKKAEERFEALKFLLVTVTNCKSQPYELYFVGIRLFSINY